MNQEAQTSTLTTIGTVLRRRALMVILSVVLASVAALVASLAQEEKYTASASLLFRDPALDQKLFGSTFVQPSQDPEREAATNVRLVSLDVVAARTAKAVGELSAEDVSRKVSVTAEGRSDVVSVNATDPSPQFAARLADEFAGEYISFRRKADRAKVEEAQRLVQRQLNSLAPAERNGPQGRSLGERAQQLQILSSLQTGNAELVQPATAPRAPSSPKTARATLLGAFLGLIVGLGLAGLFEQLDRRLRNPGDLKDLMGRPLLGTVPESRTLARSSPGHPGSLPPREKEAFSMLRANLRYFNIDHPLRSVLVTSAASGDGKSTIAWNLAFAAAAAGERVLLVEADLRHPTLGSAAQQASGAQGLSTVLAGQLSVGEAVTEHVVSIGANGASARSMDILLAGPVPPNPVDLLESERMRHLLRQVEAEYDLVVIDTPPTSVVSDAIPLVREVSGVVVVARLGKSTREAVSHLRNQLEHLKAPTLGVIANAFRLESGRYGYGYGHTHSSYEADGPNGAASKTIRSGRA